VRRLWIHHLLPLLFCAMPPTAAVLIFFAVPPAARGEYLNRLRDSAIDWIILGLGAVLFFFQTVLAWRAMRWNDDEHDFQKSGDDWLKHLASAAEWFPLLGLIGTVAAILQTFGSFGVGTRPTAEEVIQKYGPAITATGSGLFMALLNILPTWMVNTGRMLIGKLSGPPVVPLFKSSPDQPGA
jgi:hypothetical protein